MAGMAHFCFCFYLTGTLSKSLGQIIRVSASMHILFHIDKEEPLPDVISDTAIEAAIDFVEVCCQHTAYISGCGNITQELEFFESGMQTRSTFGMLASHC